MRIFSGIQPTGQKHLGNYVGAIVQYVASQERGEGIFCIVDLHAITVPFDPADLREHLELMRDVARRFNARFGEGDEVLVVPEHRIPEVGARIMDLQDPTRKMSTTGGSPQGTVFVLDEPEAIEKKLRSAVTDSGSEVCRAPDKPGVSNLIEILAAVKGVEPGAIEAGFGSSGYGDFKAAVAGAVVDYLAPVRERYLQLRADESALEAMLEDGARRAHEIAQATMLDVRERMGLGAPRRDRALR